MKSLPSRIELIKELVKPGSVGAEIGVYRGDFSKELMKCEPAMLYLIDAWEPYEEYKLDSICATNQPDNMEATKFAMKDAISAGRCKVIKGFSGNVAKGWKEPLDWIFLDSNHAYEFVLEDLNYWSRHIKPDGVIMCHDFTDTSAGAISMKFGVVQAVKEFCQKSGWMVTHVTEEGDWPSCALRRVAK